MITLSHSEFVNNTADLLIDLGGDMITLSHSKFVNKTAIGTVFIEYYIMDDKLNIRKNDFIDNSAVLTVLISSGCKSNFSLSLGYAVQDALNVP